MILLYTYIHLYENGERHTALGSEVYWAVLRQKGLHAIRKRVEVYLILRCCVHTAADGKHTALWC